MPDANISDPFWGPSQFQQRQTPLPVSPTPARFRLPSSPRTPPSTIYSGKSESKASPEYIKVFDGNRSGDLHKFLVKYTGQYTGEPRLNFIKRESLDRLKYYAEAQCEELLQVSHPDAPLPTRIFRASHYTTLEWFRPQWRSLNDNSTEEYMFHIVEDLDFFDILLGDPGPLPTREPSDNCSYPSVPNTEKVLTVCNSDNATGMALWSPCFCAYINIPVS